MVDTPVTRKEMLYAAIAGESITVPTPVTREERFLYAIYENSGTGGGGGEIIDVYTKSETDETFLKKVDAVGVKVVNGGEKFNNASTASGRYSHAEGNNTSATGQSTHAEGAGTTASANWAHAEGSSTTASGYSAHSEGASTTASAANAHAEGLSTIAAGQNQHVQGKYNVSDSSGKYAFIIGNGTSTAAASRSNAFAIDWDGKVYTGNSGVGVNIEELSDSVKSIEILSESEYEELAEKTADLYFVYEEITDVVSDSSGVDAMQPLNTDNFSEIPDTLETLNDTIENPDTLDISKPETEISTDEIEPVSDLTVQGDETE